MGKFSAAKILDAMDQKLQKAVNYLIDLLETGYVAEGRINGKNVRTEVSPKVGFQITSDGVLIGGITDINGLLASISQIITNDATDPLCWASVGQYTIGGVVMNGLAIFRKDYSLTVPVCRIMTVDDGSFHLVDGNGHVRFYCAPAVTQIADAAGVGRLYISDTGDVRMFDHNAQSRQSIWGDGTGSMKDGSDNFILTYNTTDTQIRFGGATPDNRLGVDATGAYKITAGVKVYL